MRTLCWYLAIVLTNATFWTGLQSVAFCQDIEVIDYTLYEDCVARYMREPKEDPDLAVMVTVALVDDTCYGQLQVTLWESAENGTVGAKILVAHEADANPKEMLGKAVSKDCPMITEERHSLSKKMLAAHLGKFLELRPPVIAEPVYWQHGSMYDLWVYNSFSKSEFHFFGPRNSPVNGVARNNPIIGWIQNLLLDFGRGCSQ